MKRGLFILALATLGCSPQEAKDFHASGHIEATQVRVAAKVSGRVSEVLVQEGQKVEQGAVVVKLDPADWQKELQRARAMLAAATAQLQLLERGPRREDIENVRAALAGARAELEAARRDWERLEPLVQRGIVSLKMGQDARTRWEVAQAQVAALTAQLQRLERGNRPEEIAAARAQQEAAAAAVELAAQQLAETTITAPCSGVVTTRAVEPGEVVSPGQTLLVITDLDHPWLEVYVDEPRLSQIRLNDPVEVRVDGTTQAYRGTISFISPVAEFTPKNVQTPDERAKLVFKVKVALDNPQGVFKPGMPADAYFSPHGKER